MTLIQDKLGLTWGRFSRMRLLKFGSKKKGKPIIGKKLKSSLHFSDPVKFERKIYPKNLILAQRLTNLTIRGKDILGLNRRYHLKF